jgi:putative transposase
MSGGLFTNMLLRETGLQIDSERVARLQQLHAEAYNRQVASNLPGDLEAQIAPFVEHYNHRRYNESLQNLTPADVYFGRGRTILLQRERIKRDTIKLRRLQHQLKAA